MNLTELRNILQLYKESEILEEEIKKLDSSYEEEKKQLKEQLHNLQILDIKPKIPFFDKLFKTKKYKTIMSDYENKVNKQENLSNQIKTKENNYKNLINLLKEKVINLKKKINNINSNYQTEILFYDKSRNIQLNPLGFIEITANNQDITLEYLNQDIRKDFSLDDIMLVHATSYFPNDYIIKTPHDKKITALDNNSNTLAIRNTIHFSLNGKVSSHAYGNWNDSPIVILDPLKHHIDQFACIKTNDSYTYGSVKLSNDVIILISKLEFEKIYSEHKEEIDKKKNQIIIFDGDSKVAVDNILILLGYKPQDSQTWDWANSQNGYFFHDYITTNFPNKLTAPHAYTKHKRLEENFSVRNFTLDTFRNQTNDYSNGTIITLEELYILYTTYYKYSNTLSDIYGDHNEQFITPFIKNYGISCHDNEIHLLGYKEALENYEKEVSNSQIQKVKLLLKKYELNKQLDIRHAAKGK